MSLTQLYPESKAVFYHLLSKQCNTMVSYPNTVHLPIINNNARYEMKEK